MSKDVKRKFPIIAIYDNLIGFKNIFIEANENIAIRGFKNSLIHVLNGGEFTDVDPADLSLYKLGYIDIDSGDIKPCSPVAIVHGTAVITEFHNSKCDCDNNTCVDEERIENDI